MGDECGPWTGCLAQFADQERCGERPISPPRRFAGIGAMLEGVAIAGLAAGAAFGFCAIFRRREAALGTPSAVFCWDRMRGFSRKRQITLIYREKINPCRIGRNGNVFAFGRLQPLLRFPLGNLERDFGFQGAGRSFWRALVNRRTPFEWYPDSDSRRRRYEQIAAASAFIPRGSRRGEVCRVAPSPDIPANSGFRDSSRHASLQAHHAVPV